MRPQLNRELPLGPRRCHGTRLVAASLQIELLATQSPGRDTPGALATATRLSCRTHRGFLPDPFDRPFPCLLLLGVRTVRTVPRAKKAEGWGDCWTWTALDADSKLIVSFRLGSRDAGTAHDFMSDVASRLASRVQLTTDGHKPYLEAVEDAFGGDVDYAMLVKIDGSIWRSETRYSPAKCLGAVPRK